MLISKSNLIKINEFSWFLGITLFEKASLRIVKDFYYFVDI
jgi:hypothetical protein